MQGFRPDIQGLRAVAIGAVLLAHAGIPAAAGGYVGVDVFFVISGFLITGSLVRELERTGSISLASFYARRVKRLLPLAITVLAVVVVGAWVLLPPLRADEAAHDVMAAGVYALNWKLAVDSVDYFATGDQSPIEHFWSLAVEEQFYLAWPALLLAATWWWRRRGGALRPALWALLGLTALASFGYALHLTATEPSAAYFSTPARVWELAIGGLLALALMPRRVEGSGLAPGPRVAATAAWSGAAAIAASVLLLDAGAAFPGPPALLPTLGAAALILAGAGPGRSLPLRMLETAPMQHVGALSYAWYLWHWPVLVFGAAVLGPLSIPQGVALTLASLIPTAITHRAVEEPLRRTRTRRRRIALAAAPAGALATAALGIGLLLALPSPPTLAEGEAAGATRLEQTKRLQPSAGAIRPVPRKAGDDRGRSYADGCLVEAPDVRSPRCVYGNPRGRTTVVLYGDSHAMQWFPALERVARRRGWRLVQLTKAACPVPDVTVNNAELRRRYDECPRWRTQALRRIARERPDMIVAASSLHYNPLRAGKPLRGRTARSVLSRQLVPALRRLATLAPRVTVIRDQPRPPRDIPGCVAEALDDLRSCAFDRRRALGGREVERPAVARVRRARLVDATSRFCPRELCPAVIGDVLVYRNSGHLTATYARSLTSWLSRRLPSLSR